MKSRRFRFSTSLLLSHAPFLLHTPTILLVRVVCFFFSHTFTFQLLDKPWSPVSSLLPPGSRLQFSSRILVGSAIPLLVDFSSSECMYVVVAKLSHSRAFRKTICAHEKVLTNLYEYHALGGIRIHETDLYQARGQPDTPPGRPCRTR